MNNETVMMNGNESMNVENVMMNSNQLVNNEKVMMNDNQFMNNAKVELMNNEKDMISGTDFRNKNTMMNGTGESKEIRMSNEIDLSDDILKYLFFKFKTE